MNTTDTAPTAPAPTAPTRIRTDASGYRIFSEGELGAAHATAHQMLDLGWFELGHTLLSQALEGRAGSGSQWVHIQWHLLVFELETGRIADAVERFTDHILGAAADAPTDAPAALWRIRLATDDRITLPWRRVWRNAVDRLWTSDDPYVTLHHLLAIAGAGDLSTLDLWLTCAAIDGDRPAPLQTLAIALRSFVAGDWELAVAAFDESLDDLPSLGGSRAQNQLFSRIHRHAETRALNHNPGPGHSLAVN